MLPHPPSAARACTLAVAVGLAVLPTIVIASGPTARCHLDVRRDGSRKLAHVFDSSSERLVLADDLALESRVPCESALAENPQLPPDPGSTVQMLLVDSVLPSIRVTSATGFDSDHDGRSEFVLREDVGTLWTTVLDFYESVSDDTFELVHFLHIPPDSESSYYPGDLGDADGDGLAELIVFGRTVNDFSTRIYESESPDGYPNQLVWEAPGDWWEVGAKIRDTDDDGRLEVVLAGQESNQQRIAVYENQANDSFALTYHQVVPLTTSQSMDVAKDLDGDGRHEILLGGLEGSTTKIYAVENTGDNAYVQAWSQELIHSDGQRINVEVIVDVGDLDQDGCNEFLAGGKKTVGSPNDPFLSVLYLFEATGNDTFEPVTSFVLPTNVFGDTSANVADVDADGDLEIVFGTWNQVRVYRNVGDNTWSEVWSTFSWLILSIGAGDHDGDGKTEIVFQNDRATDVWEISPSDAADDDGDGATDVVDNCPSDANPGQEDFDADGVGDACDNCVHGPNPAQGPAIFGQEVVALDESRFGWAGAADIVYVRGGLDLVSVYGIDLVETLPVAVEFTDAEVPPAGGFYYLVKPDCSVGSWQSSLGAEPGRDEVLP